MGQVAGAEEKEAEKGVFACVEEIFESLSHCKLTGDSVPPSAICLASEE